MLQTLRLPRRLICVLALIAGAAPLEARSETYAVDTTSSRVRIHLGRAGLVKFLGHEHEIEAPVAEGTIVVTDGDPERSHVAMRFEAARLRIVPGSEPADDVPEVERRMRGTEVLDVARYPEITFRSTSVTRQSGDGHRFRLVVGGSLALRGRAISVEVPLEVTAGPAGIQARASLMLDLRDLGIDPPSVAGVVKVAKRFRLEFEIEASPTSPRPNLIGR